MIPFFTLNTRRPGLQRRLKAAHRILVLAAALCLAKTVPAAQAGTGGPIKMVVTAAIVSDKGIAIYDQLGAYLSEKIGREVLMISGLSYEDANRMLDDGTIQVGYVCGLPYVHKAAAGKQELLAVPVIATKKGRFPDARGYEDIPGKYYSYTIVRKDSPYRSWADLKGKTYAFNDITSNSGYNMPRYKLVRLGARSWEDYFSKVVVSGSHEESVRLVARGIVDASSVDSLVLDFDRHLGDPDALNVRIIEHLIPGGAGIPPVVISSKADPALAAALRTALLNMHKDPKGRAILAKALTRRFIAPDDRNYDDIRMMERAAREAGFRDFAVKPRFRRTAD